MTGPTTPACGLCRFWQPAPVVSGPGECRRRSPRGVQDARTGAWRSLWPPTWITDWCGDFRPDEPEPKPKEPEVVEVSRTVIWEGPTDDRP